MPRVSVIRTRLAGCSAHAPPLSSPAMAHRVVPAPTIHKFGGAALADAGSIRRVVSIIRDQPRPAVIVVSALAGVTDALLEAARLAAAGDASALRDAAATLRAQHDVIARALV